MGPLPEGIWKRAKTAIGLAVILLAATSAASGQQPAPPGAAADFCTSWPTGSLDAAALFKCVFKASRRASDTAKHPVEFDVDDASSETAPAFAAAAAATSEALETLADQPGGMSALARIAKVRFALGQEPSANFADSALTVTIVPARRSAGLPSTDQIERAVKAGAR